MEAEDEGSSGPEATVMLIERIRAGDQAAIEVLFSRYLPALRRWAHGRLPRTMRDVADTDDLVQVTLMRALNRLGEFEVRQAGSFLAYLRHVLLNEVRAQVRRHATLPLRQDVSEDMPDQERISVLELLIGDEQMQAYQQALSTLPERQQEILVLRLEFGMSYPEIAAETGSKADAVRIMATRATALLAERLGRRLG
jgi:RNA polymerase sigma factor (sigma-70 family)